MNQIRPVSDLRNHFADISRIVHETDNPVFLTKNGYGDMVVLSMEAYQKRMLKGQIDQLLLESEQEFQRDASTIPHSEVMERLRKIVRQAKEEGVHVQD